MFKYIKARENQLNMKLDKTAGNKPRSRDYIHSDVYFLFNNRIFEFSLNFNIIDILTPDVTVFFTPSISAIRWNNESRQPTNLATGSSAPVLFARHD